MDENVIAEKVTQITDTTKKEIKRQIQEGFEEGDSTVEIARRIESCMRILHSAGR